MAVAAATSPTRPAAPPWSRSNAPQLLCSLAAEAEGWLEGSVTLEAGHFVSRGESVRIPFAELAGRLARVEGGMIREQADHEAETGWVTVGLARRRSDRRPRDRPVGVERIVAVHDVGYALHPVGWAGQIEGGLIQGFGLGVMEELAVQQGGSRRSTSASTRCPPSPDVPPLTSS